MVRTGIWTTAICVFGLSLAACTSDAAKRRSGPPPIPEGQPPAGASDSRGMSAPAVQATDVQPAAGQAQPGTTPAQPGDRIRITRLDELPQHVYPLKSKAVDALSNPATIRDLAARVRADVEADLAKYEINDPATLQRMYQQLLTIAVIEERFDDVLAWNEKIKALEDKEASRLMMGVPWQATAAARRAAGSDPNAPAFKQAFRRELEQRIAALPWDVVQDEIQRTKGQVEMYSENLIKGLAKTQFQPTLDKTGELDADAAGALLRMYVTLKQRLPVRDELVAVYQAVIDAHKETKPDIWKARDVTLPAGTCEPVLLAAWDSGTDPAPFESILWRNPHEQPDGRDNDNNGFVDDVHGPAYDIDARPTTGELYPLGDAAGRIAQVMAHMKGLMDMQAAIDSPEASVLKRHLADLPPEQVEGFIEDLGLAGNYAHGTHVAGILVAGNPCARLLIARLSYDHKTVPIARTLEWGRRDAAKCRDTVEYFKRAGVRVVNMSWGEAMQDAEDSLEKNGLGQSAEERRELARQVFALQRSGLFEALQQAPQILFVCAAGNEDNDVEFDEFIPSSFDLPNVLVVGAVDQAGEPTSFTSAGRTVQIYANGFEVESLVPGGTRMKMSGTSMASPQVANLAGKLCAVDPGLTPQDAIALIKKGADPTTKGEVTYRLLNPQRSLELCRARRGS